MSLAAQRMTLAEFAPYAEDSQYELVDGELRKREMRIKTVKVGGLIYSLLQQFCASTGSGEPSPDGVPYRCFPDDEDRVRKPDVSWFSARRWKKEYTDATYIEAAPDLVIEVVSPNDISYEVEQKVEQFLNAGIQEAWIVFPHIQKTKRRFADGTGKVFAASEEFDASPLIPGFRWTLADILARV